MKQEAIAAIAESSDAAKEAIREAVKKAHVANNSGGNEWYTPELHIGVAVENGKNGMLRPFQLPQRPELAWPKP